MNTEQALQKLSDVIRRKHLALATERSYCLWLKRYCDHIGMLPVHLPSEQKLERFLTALAKDNVSASTQNQAFNAIIFFYKEVGNPNGIPSFSPGLERERLPWVNVPGYFPTLKGLHPFARR